MFTDENLHVHNHATTADEHQPLPIEICGAWKVTARAVDHVFQGDLTLKCRQQPRALALLR